MLRRRIVHLRLVHSNAQLAFKYYYSLSTKSEATHSFHCHPVMHNRLNIALRLHSQKTGFTYFWNSLQITVMVNSLPVMHNRLNIDMMKYKLGNYIQQTRKVMALGLTMFIFRATVVRLLNRDDFYWLLNFPGSIDQFYLSVYISFKFRSRYK